MTSSAQLQATLKQTCDSVLFDKEVLNPIFDSCFTLSRQAVAALV